MKRLSIFIALLVCAVASSQNISDVLRYNNTNDQGTARYQAMGGAFGALGGELSSLGDNPAGSAIFDHGAFTVSGAVYHRDNETTYFNTTSNNLSTDLDINQLGGVLVFNNSQENSGWNKLALAFNYDMVSNFTNDVFLKGTSNKGIDNYFLDFAAGIPVENILLLPGEYIEEAYLDIGSNSASENAFADQQAFLGYYGGIISDITTNGGGSTYQSNALYNTVNQRFSRTTSGYNGKYTLNMAGRYRKRLYLGMSLNFHSVRYDQIDLFREEDYANSSELIFVDFDNSLRTEGIGFSFSTGAIYKLTDNLRVGGSYQSPTWYRLEDRFAQRINSNLANNDISFIDFNVENIFERYTIKTPAKLSGSLAYVFNKNGLISVDYGYQDMGTSKLAPKDDSVFTQVNEQIKDELGVSSSIKIGGEYRIKNVSIRAGYRYDQSPYKNGNLIGDLQVASGGIGYGFEDIRLDLTVSHSTQETALPLFGTGLTTQAGINNANTNLILSYTYNF